MTPWADGRTIRLQVVSGRTMVGRLALVSLRKGHDHWCRAIGGEAGILNNLPIGKKLGFQAVVTAQGVTVMRNRPIALLRG